MSVRENLRLNIRSLRNAKRMTQREVAEQFGIKRSLYGAMEEGRSTPSLDLIVKFSKFYSITVDIILSDKLFNHGKDVY